ncbi:LOW QUALITY PROTEIN: Helitron helicase [Phytophthora megakarya]|uniref:Helitron helicase n=1 Tax=Phytophthora megakarya TaxID=4795 RepID=A0A225WYW6_9STRA|nr:LOW QUALITY PROTEIN: Helitron helicase [Phytophthora megakarya]
MNESLSGDEQRKFVETKAFPKSGSASHSVARGGASESPELAEIPGTELFPDHHAAVTTGMTHGPCGRGINRTSTKNDGLCSKRFHMAFLDETRSWAAGPMQRRKSAHTYFNYNGAATDTSRQREQTTMTQRILDNRWVVPCNPYLCQKYDCYVNVEVRSTIQSIKYLYEYVYKGQDPATVVPRDRGRRDGNDENNAVEERVHDIMQYLDARYLSSPEVCWINFKYEIQNKYHHVHWLPVHDEGQQRLSGPGPDIARRLLYHEVSIHFVWVKWVTDTFGNCDSVVEIKL